MKYRSFTKDQLVTIARRGNEVGYNRRLDADALDRDLDPNHMFPVSFTLPHEHIAGEKVDPHVRVMVVLNSKGETATMDMSWEDYESLEESDIPDPDQPVLEGDVAGADTGHRTGRRR